MKKLFVYLLMVVAILSVAYFSYQYVIEQKVEKHQLEVVEAQLVSFETNKGHFVIELYPQKSPESVQNFVEYIKAGFYRNTIFHRAISGVILQGGGYSSGMLAKATRSTIVNESNNGLVNSKGTISMARKLAANSATSQFFINLRDNSNLDYQASKAGYAVFGKVVSGLALLEELAKGKTQVEGIHKHVPIEEIKIVDVKFIPHNGLKEVTTDKLKNITDITKEKFVEGIHYVRLKEPVELLNSSKVEVVSAFSFGCGHCYGIYPLTQQWSLDNQKQVTFSYFHAVWNNAMRIYARAYYTAIELKVESRVHLPIYEAVVINQQKLSNRDELAHFFVNYGVKREKFIEVFDSDLISKRVEQAEKLTKKFQLASVPEFIVAGKYRVDPMRAGGQNEMFELLDFLVNKEQDIDK